MPCPSRIICCDCLTFCRATSSRQIRCPTCKAQLNRDRVKAWRKANPEKRAAIRRRYFAKGYLAKWHQANPGRKNELERNRYHRDRRPWLRAKRRYRAGKSSVTLAASLLRTAM